MTPGAGHPPHLAPPGAALRAEPVSTAVASARRPSSARVPTLAILPWGLVFEDYLHPLGLTVDEFLAEITGGWLFNYVAALRTSGIESTIFLVSAETRTTKRGVHEPSGARYVILPAPARLRWARPLLGVRRGKGNGTADPPVPPTPPAPPGRVPAAPLPAAAGTPPAPPRRRAWARVLFWDSLRRFLTPTRALAEAIRGEGCHGILCQEYEDVRFDACVTMGRALGLPVFATFQGGVPRPGTRPTPMRRRALLSCAGIIVGSAAEAARVRREYGVEDHRIGRIPNPVDHPGGNVPTRAEARTALDLPPGARIVGWHGRVARRAKGLDLLVDAWRRLELAPDRARLLLVGSGRDAAWLRGEIGPELASGSIVWVDRYVRDRDELFGYLAACDLYAFPSRHEGFPVAPLEAMALGLPVVAGGASGVDEILESPERDGGIRVPGDDAVALATALQALLEDPERADRLGRAARRRMEEHFSVSAIGRRLAPWLREHGFPSAKEDER
jgi:glycosyltransferase involved in cell wall biosynthesis